MTFIFFNKSTITIMSRPFRIVEHKIAETDFFLTKLNETTYNRVPNEARNYLSAFLASSRSITFALQASLSHLSDFKTWYEIHQQNLRKNKLAKYFLEARNYSQKVGYYPLTSFRYYQDNNGKQRMEYHFDRTEEELTEFVPEEDIMTACKKYFIMLLEVVYDSYQFFSTQVDPEQFLTINNLKKTGKTIEDFEEELGFPRGCTNIGGLTDEERIKALRQKKGRFLHDNNDHYFAKYLGKNRLGVIIE